MTFEHTMNSLGFRRSFGLVFSLLFCLKASGFQLTFSDNGSLDVGFEDEPLLVESVSMVESVTFQTGPRTFKTVPTTPVSQSFLDGNTQQQTYPWGELTHSFSVDKNRLIARLEISNQSDDVLADFRIKLFMMRTSEEPPEGSWTTLDDIVAEPFPAGGQNVFFTVDSLAPPIRLSSEKIDLTDGTRGAVLRFSGGVPEMHAGGVDMARPGRARVEPGETLALEYSMVSAPKETPRHIAASHTHEAFFRRHNQGQVWEDRRPIGAMFIASSGHTSMSNPRGFFWDPDLDVGDSEAVRKRALAFAERSVEALLAVDAQGFVLWDIEGIDRPSIAFVGDPRMMPILAPEMDPIADEFFAVFRDAGLRTGVTLRPTQVYFNESDKQWQHGTGSHNSVDRNPLGEEFEGLWPLPGERWPDERHWWEFFPIVERMTRKIEYAHDRWGCTLFYIDTNGVFRQPGTTPDVSFVLLSALVFQELKARNPDVLIMPELWSRGGTFHTAYWSATAPYMELRGGHRGTPTRVRRLLPHSFSVVNVSDGNIEQARETLVQSVRDGDILMMRGWFHDARNRIVREIYEEAAADNQFFE